MIKTITLTTDCEKYSFETSFDKNDVSEGIMFYISDENGDIRVHWDDEEWIYFILYPTLAGESADYDEAIPDIPIEDRLSVYEMLKEADNIGFFDYIKNDKSKMSIYLN